jgi:hypothetical protein
MDDPALDQEKGMSGGREQTEHVALLITSHRTTL